MPKSKVRKRPAREAKRAANASKNEDLRELGIPRGRGSRKVRLTEVQKALMGGGRVRAMRPIGSGGDR